MAGFQFTPSGIIPLGAAVDLGDPSAPSPGAVFAPPPRIERIEPVYEPRAALAAAVVESSRTKLDPGKPLTGKQLMAVAKARIKELDRLLRQVPALEAERESLKRLVDAASAAKRGPTVVRSLRASGT